MENQTRPFSFHNNTKLDKRDEEIAKIEIGVQGAIFFLALFGNSVVLMALRLRRQKTSRINLFIMHLSVADILVAFFNILPQLAWDITFRFKSGELMCRLVKYMQVMVMYLSTYILVMTAIDRYLAICRPLSNYVWTPRKARVMVGIALMTSLILSLPQPFLFTMREVIAGSGIYDCYMREELLWITPHYVTFFTCAVYFLPFLTLLFTYGNIYWQVCVKAELRDEPNDGKMVFRFTKSPSETVSMRISRTRSIINRDAEQCSGRQSNFKSSRERSLSQAKLKTVKLTFVVIIAYVICWSPFFITQLWRAYTSDAPQTHGAFVICMLLGSLNSCCNPWIYIAFSGSLVRKLLPCYTRRRSASCQRQANRCAHFLAENRRCKRSSLTGLHVQDARCSYHVIYENERQDSIELPQLHSPKRSSSPREPPERKHCALDIHTEKSMDSRKRNLDMTHEQKSMECVKSGVCADVKSRNRPSSAFQEY